MKKSSFAAMLLGTISGVLFALGMCMALIPEWNSLKPGIAFGCAGILMGLAAVMVWRRMEHRQPVLISGRAVLSVLAGIAGALAFSVGMCFSMVWGRMLSGILIGLLGIVMLLCLIPLIRGIKN